MRPEDRLISLTLALEDALHREAWDEADDLFAARDTLVSGLSPHFPYPREVDDIDARILNYLRSGMAEIRRELQTIERGRRTNRAYAAVSTPSIAVASV